MNVDVSAESVGSEAEELSVESEHVENLTAEEFAVELVRIISENENLSKKHVASRDTIMLDMSSMPIDESHYED